MKLKDLLIESSGWVDANELMKKIKECGIDKQAKKYRKKTIVLISVNDILGKGIPVGAVDGMAKKTDDEIIKYVKQHNNKGLLVVQFSNEKIDIYPIGEKALKRYKKGGKPDAKIIAFLKSNGIENYELMVGNVDVEMIQVKDLKKCKNIDEEMYQRLLKNGLKIESWGGEIQKIKSEDAFLVLDGDIVYKVENEGNLPTNYEPA